MIRFCRSIISQISFFALPLLTGVYWRPCQLSMHNLIRQSQNFKSCSWRVGDLRCWESLTVVPARNKANRLSSVNHTAKTVHHYDNQIRLMLEAKFGEDPEKICIPRQSQNCLSILGSNRATMNRRRGKEVTI